ncbi:MAG: DUF599 family protein, partial [Deltaproteobacteria bacterium]|nr:DUF599 family protein [Deltaproteobacteria bacterium]
MHPTRKHVTVIVKELLRQASVSLAGGIMIESPPYLELCLTSASFLLLIIYHVHLVYQVRRRPLTTAIGITNHLRGHWVESIMQDKRDILA